MQPPNSNLFREHPRKFMAAAVACGIINPPSLVIGIFVFGYAFMCWIDEDRFNAVQKNAWDRYYAELDTSAAQLVARRELRDAHKVVDA